MVDRDGVGAKVVALCEPLFAVGQLLVRQTSPGKQPGLSFSNCRLASVFRALESKEILPIEARRPSRNAACRMWLVGMAVGSLRELYTSSSGDRWEAGRDERGRRSSFILQMCRQAANRS